MKHAILICTFLFSTVASAGALRADVLAQLSGVEDVPNHSALASLGPGVQAELIEIALDPSVRMSQRGRAVFSLGHFPSPASRSTLETFVSGDDRFLARKAVYALGNGWGADAIPQLTQSLASADVHLREASAIVLGRINDPAARAALTQRVENESSPVVRQAIEHALQQ